MPRRLAQKDVSEQFAYAWIVSLSSLRQHRVPGMELIFEFTQVAHLCPLLQRTVKPEIYQRREIIRIERRCAGKLFASFFDLLTSLQVHRPGIQRPGAPAQNHLSIGRIELVQAFHFSQIFIEVRPKTLVFRNLLCG